MPVNLQVPARLPAVAGVELAAVAAGLKNNGEPDLVLIALCEDAVTTGVFTQNSFCAAPVTVCRDHLQRSDKVRALLINSGGANAATGAVGEQNARRCCELVAKEIGISAEAVLPFSTGVIGEQLPMKNIEGAVSNLAGKLASDQWPAAARGIMTTDILPKMAAETLLLDGREITIAGIAKGSGMIQPNMATMLAHIFTDASVDQNILSDLLNDAAAVSFNAISVDGDTSTNDSCTLTATGAASVHLAPGSDNWTLFRNAVIRVFQTLAQAIVRDGEGATKFITINVSGGSSEQQCRDVALTVANSPLVKTAFFASDANVGRIVMAVGRARSDLDINSFSLAIGGVPVLENGQPAAGYSDDKGQAVMADSEIEISIDLGLGSLQWTAWTCDFSYDYVKINAEYRS